jgi:hypothetical protein
MSRIALGLAWTVVPALMVAQAPDSTRAGSHTQAQAQAHAGVGARAEVPPLPRGLSVEARGKIEAMIEMAREKHLPTQPMSDRVAEGKAKGASDDQMVSECRKAMLQLEASQTALIKAGREHPSDEEVARGAQVIARGATSAQLEAFVRHAPSDRRLEVAFEVLTQLEARGVPVDRALTVVGGKLSGGASDGQLVSVLGSGQAGLGLGVGRDKPDAGAAAGGTVTGALGAGIIRKP